MKLTSSFLSYHMSSRPRKNSGTAFSGTIASFAAISTHNGASLSRNICKRIALFIALAGLSATAHAMDFKTGSPDGTDVNPFYFDGTSAGNWSFNVPNGTRTGDWWVGCTGSGPNGDFECVQSNNANSVTIYGGSSTSEEITWTSVAGINLNPPLTSENSYIVSFDITYFPDQTGDSEGFYRWGTQSVPVLGTLLNQTATLTYNQTLTFGIANGNFSGYLEISNFSYKEVPAPLPAAGAATAFSFSRRLRRRIKGEPSTSSQRSRLKPAHPSTYLNLAPAALQATPLSFQYPCALPFGALQKLPEAPAHASAAATAASSTSAVSG